MNSLFRKILTTNQQPEEKFKSKDSKKVFKDIANRANREATEILSEGSIHLSMGYFLTDEDIEDMRIEEQQLRQANESDPLGRPQSPPKSNCY